MCEVYIQTVEELWHVIEGMRTLMRIFEVRLTSSAVQTMILFGSQYAKHLNHSKKGF